MSVSKLRTLQTRHTGLDSLVAIWTMRILLNLGGLRRLGSLLIGENNVLSTVGLEHLLESDTSRSQWLNMFKVRQRQLESVNTMLPDVVEHNLELLMQTVGLSDIESGLLIFSAVLHQYQGLDDAADTLGELRNDQVAEILAVILEYPLNSIKAALSHNGLLARSGLLRLVTETHCLRSKMDLLAGMGARLFERHDQVHDLLANYFSRPAGTALGHKDFPHIAADYHLLTRYLRGTMKARLSGANVLLYGPPGTGKSQLAQVIARHLKLSLYEINMMKIDGTPLTGANRFGAYQLGQQALARQDNTLLLFDEIEDVFPPDESLVGDRTDRNSPYGKAWVNRLLEENPLPAIWISNCIEQIDKAFLRRFDYVMKLDHPPRKVRERILRQRLQQLPVSRQWIAQVAENHRLSPAMIASAARVTRLARQRRSNCEQDMERLLSNALCIKGVQDSRHLLQIRCETPYRLEVLNTTMDMSKLVGGIKRHPNGRFCLYGPSGTGKTGFGRFLARKLDMPLHVIHASDLLDPYVGMTERNIAGAFERASEDEAILLLDEADSFLGARSMASKNWEVSQVNELLTQMENFEGLFICTTNRVDCFDSASLRRFDLKIGFDYLAPPQVWVLFCEVLKARDVALPEGNEFEKRLGASACITPGDFVTVLRKQPISGENLTAEFLLSGVIDESAFRQKQASQGIGFMAGM